MDAGREGVAAVEHIAILRAGLGPVDIGLVPAGTSSAVTRPSPPPLEHVGTRANEHPATGHSGYPVADGPAVDMGQMRLAEDRRRWR